ncbi:type 1 glutamine amidotransferase domain-containing protein [Chitinophaga arvensicola]|uniref:ThiJ/PfpI family-like n=1 Tax=Chitinophaga arvensicola TaxID=29529 RepID=A0A1I0S9V8_9BACT|nr:type 1 glutamine amidotransferase domain-containing protein [Chitinophaga arvensicola]SEW51905.1 ThiJ/PfpI family-like [Chitinophaga arvensicola]
MKKVLVPLPDYGFDPTEAAIPWLLLTAKGYDVQFATPGGYSSMADLRMLRGEGLGIWKWLLQARADAVVACHQMSNSEAFCNPLKYSDIRTDDFDALLLPGGHDKGMRVYLESSLLQQAVSRFFIRQKPVAAICHGVVLAARSKDPVTGLSVLYDYKTTALLASQERTAWQLTRAWLKDYYLTYPITVQAEVSGVLREPGQFLSGPLPLLRDDPRHLEKGFTVQDRHYLSARWPGDVYRFSAEFIKMLG